MSCPLSGPTEAAFLLGSETATNYPLTAIHTVNLIDCPVANYGLGVLMIIGWEWIVVVGVLLIFFLWGPSRIPQLARAIGQTRKELDVASNELTSPIQGRSSPVGADDALVETGKKLGINTEGKTRNEISEEIVRKANVSKATNSSV
jgi:sec-independent protein translocase protein TatA